MTATAAAPSGPACPPRVARPRAPLGPVDRAVLAAVVVGAVVLVMEVAASDVHPHTSLVEELGADSLALVEIVEVVETRLRPLAGRCFAIADADIETLVTPGVFVDYLATWIRPA